MKLILTSKIEVFEADDGSIYRFDSMSHEWQKLWLPEYTWEPVFWNQALELSKAYMEFKYESN